jgi:hypothetical protein
MGVWEHWRLMLVVPSARRRRSQPYTCTDVFAPVQAASAVRLTLPFFYPYSCAVLGQPSSNQSITRSGTAWHIYSTAIPPCGAHS